MRKIISLVLTVAILLCCICFSGCNQEIPNPTPNDLIEALNNGGFKKSFYITSDFAKNIYDTNEKAYCVDVGGAEGDIYIDTDLGDPDQQILRSLTIRNYDGNKNQEDTIKILNIIMPLFDDNFDNCGEEIITNLEKLSKDKNNAEKLRITSDCYHYSFTYEYHGFTFFKHQDENYNDESISIYGMMELYMKRNNISTFEELYSRGEAGLL